MGNKQGVKCKHPDCLFRNQNAGEYHACEYSLMTGRTRTRKNERLDTANCRHYVPRPKMPRRRGVGITGPLWEPVALALQKAGFDIAEIARILGLEPEGVEKCLNARVQRKPKGANDSLSRFDWNKARRLYDEGKTDRQIAAGIGCSFQRVQHWRASHGLASNGQKGRRPTQ